MPSTTFAHIGAAGWSIRLRALTTRMANILKFVCGFHAWTYNLEGQCTHIMDKENWQGVLTEQRTGLGKVKVDTWGGWYLGQTWIRIATLCAPISNPLPRCWICLPAGEGALQVAKMGDL